MLYKARCKAELLISKIEIGLPPPLDWDLLVRIIQQQVMPGRRGRAVLLSLGKDRAQDLL